MSLLEIPRPTTEAEKVALREAVWKEYANLDRDVAEAKKHYQDTVEFINPNLSDSEINAVLEEEERKLDAVLRKQEAYVACWARYL
jgi:hypothetical protein